MKNFVWRDLISHKVSEVSSVHVVSNRSKKSREYFKMWDIRDRDDSRIIYSISEISVVW